MTNLAACSPAELTSSQMGIIEHCVDRINALQLELAEAEQALNVASQGDWNVKPFRARVRRLERKIEYFKKVGHAVNKGYLVIPDVWNSDLFAIRVKDKDRVRWTNWGSANIQKLPVGEGEYVDAQPIEDSHLVKNEHGNMVQEVYNRRADSEIDFPVSIVHPAVIDATQRAMADKVFDTLRIARQGGDPFILGQIFDPTISYHSGLTFFVAWFLDTRSI